MARTPLWIARGRRGEGDAPAARANRRPARAVVPFTAAVLAVCLGAPAGIAQDSAGSPRRASAALEAAARYAGSRPSRPDTLVLAAQGTQEGHWRFVNRAGEMFTAGTPDEMKHVVAVLYPAAKAGARLALYLTHDTVFRQGVAFKARPASAELHMLAGGESYRLLQRTEAPSVRLYAEVRSNLAVELDDPHLLEEALWHLSRPLRKAGIRLVALEPGGPAALAASPHIDKSTGRALVDAINPASLTPAMGGVSSQTLVVLGRVERNLIYFRPSSGPEKSLALDDLMKAADAADVGVLVLLGASTPRQPGGRNALWRGGGATPDADGAPVLADLLNALAGPSRRMAVATSRAGRRTVLDVTLVGDLSGASAPRPADTRLAGIGGDLAAAGIYAVRANLLSAERQSDLDQRIIAGVPAAVQAGYAALFVLGLLGTPVARSWWAHVWPPEATSEYAGRSGYWAARVVRSAVFVLVFLPLTALVAAPYNVGSQISEAVRGPVLGWRRITGRGAGGTATTAWRARPQRHRRGTNREDEMPAVRHARRRKEEP